VLLVLLARVSPAAADSVPAAPSYAQEISARLQSTMPLAVEGFLLDRALLVQVYGKRANAAIWEDHAHWAVSLQNALADAGTEGIPPASLGLQALQQALADPALAPAERDLILTDRFLAYAAILAHGRIDISSIDALWTLPAPLFDPAAAITSLIAADGPAPVLQQMLPSSAGYERLRAAYGKYQQIAALGGWRRLPAATSLKFGDTGPLVASLSDRLAAEGDLASNQAGIGTFGTVLANAVSRFQQRHGLLVDGRVGPATLAALDISAEDRVRQLGINLERLRAMPRAWPATRIEAEQS